MKVEIIEPHGLCAGVNGAIAKALKLRGVYCLHELVHNEIVIAELKDLGFTFVDDIEDVPEGETVVFSAHGVPPRVHEIASARKLKVVDTTCPFVSKVHRAARDFAERGLPVVIIGDPKHLLTTIEALEAKTAQFDRQFIVAISYGGRAEIVDAVNAVVKAGEPVTEETFIALVFGQHRGLDRPRHLSI